MNAQQIIDHYQMQPLPREGGWYTETYRADEKIPHAALDKRYHGDRNHSTAILYLLTNETVSKMHRVKSDEIFCYHLGDPVLMLQLNDDGSSREVIIGPDIQAGHRQQVVVKRGRWQGTRLAGQGAWCLMSCIVSPGFEFDDYEHGERDQLIRQWPACAEAIRQLT